MDRTILVSSVIVVSIIGISTGITFGGIQFGEMSDNLKTIVSTLSGISSPDFNTQTGPTNPSISTASIGFIIGAILVDPDNQPNSKDEYLLNSVSECIFHSDTSIPTDTCVVCTLQDENDVTLAKGKIDLPNGYDASQSISIIINELENPDSNSVSKVKGIMIEVCETGDGFGCTPGYWKNHHFKWTVTGFNPSDNFRTTFGLSATDVITLKVDGVDVLNPTLGDAIQAQGAGINALARHSVAALLNSASSIDYPLSTTQVIVNFNAAYTSGDYEPTKNIFDQYNNLGCPFGNIKDNGETESKQDVKEREEIKDKDNGKEKDDKNQSEYKSLELKTVAKIKPTFEDDSKFKTTKENKK